MIKRPPREPRRQTFISGKMRTTAEWIDVSIANVSATGLLVKCPAAPPVGTKVEIGRRGMRIVGEVVWSRGTRFGLRSFHEIDQAALVEAGLKSARPDISPPQKKRWWHWRSSR
jgi:hypothetical protein